MGWDNSFKKKKHQPFPPAKSTYLQKSHRSRSQTSHRRVLSVECCWRGVASYAYKQYIRQRRNTREIYNESCNFLVYQYVPKWHIYIYDIHLYLPSCMYIAHYTCLQAHTHKHIVVTNVVRWDGSDWSHQAVQNENPKSIKRPWIHASSISTLNVYGIYIHLNINLQHTPSISPLPILSLPSTSQNRQETPRQDQWSNDIQIHVPKLDLDEKWTADTHKKKPTWL